MWKYLSECIACLSAKLLADDLRIAMSSVVGRAVLIAFSGQINLSLTVDCLHDYFSDSKKSRGGPIDANFGQKGFVEARNSSELIVVFQSAKGRVFQWFMDFISLCIY